MFMSIIYSRRYTLFMKQLVETLRLAANRNISPQQRDRVVRVVCLTVSAMSWHASNFILRYVDHTRGTWHMALETRRTFRLAE